MSKITTLLNNRKKPALEDWHRADIVAAIHKSGTTFQKLSLSLGYNDGVLRNALNYPAPKYERQIAEHLNVTVQTIWPSRYHEDGTSKSGRGERGRGRYKAKFNGLTKPCNVNSVKGK